MWRKNREGMGGGELNSAAVLLNADATGGIQFSKGSSGNMGTRKEVNRGVEIAPAST